MIHGDNPNNDNPVISIAAIMQSGNLFVYCMGNPVMFIDILGTNSLVANIINELISFKKDYIKAEKENNYELKILAAEKGKFIKAYLKESIEYLNGASKKSHQTMAFKDLIDSAISYDLSGNDAEVSFEKWDYALQAAKNLSTSDFDSFNMSRGYSMSLMQGFLNNITNEIKNGQTYIFLTIYDDNRKRNVDVYNNIDQEYKHLVKGLPEIHM